MKGSGARSGGGRGEAEGWASSGRSRLKPASGGSASRQSAQRTLGSSQPSSRRRRSSPCSPQGLSPTLQQHSGTHVPGVQCPGRPPLPSCWPEERAALRGQPRPSAAKRAAAAGAAEGHLCRGQADCQALPEGEGPNFALVFRGNNLCGRDLPRAWKTSLWYGAMPKGHRTPEGRPQLCRAEAWVGTRPCGASPAALPSAARLEPALAAPAESPNGSGHSLRGLWRVARGELRLRGSVGARSLETL